MNMISKKKLKDIQFLWLIWRCEALIWMGRRKTFFKKGHG
jgi:hypothetical protein